MIIQIAFYSFGFCFCCHSPHLIRTNNCRKKISKEQHICYLYGVIITEYANMQSWLCLMCDQSCTCHHHSCSALISIVNEKGFAFVIASSSNRLKIGFVYFFLFISVVGRFFNKTSNKCSWTLNTHLQTRRLNDIDSHYFEANYNILIFNDLDWISVFSAHFPSASLTGLLILQKEYFFLFTLKPFVIRICSRRFTVLYQQNQH